MTIKLTAAALAILALTACDEAEKPKEAAADKPATSAEAPEKAPAKETEEAKAEPKKLDSEGLEAVADAVKFEQGEKKDKSFAGKIENTSEHAIGRLEYKAFAYGADGELIEMVEGKYPKALAAGASSDVDVGPFEKAAAQDDVSIEVVVSWMNVSGTSYQRPVPKDRAKGGPNNALKK